MSPLRDSEFAEQKARVQPLVAFWLETMGFGTWNIDIGYWNYTKDSNEDVIADCSSSWEYKNAGISFYMPKVATITDLELDAAVVHELGHCLVGPMASTYRGRKGDFEQMMEESTVTAVQQAITWAYRAGAREGLEGHPWRGKKRLDKSPKRRLK